MQAIYQDCANPGTRATEALLTPEIEFHPDDDHQGSYFQLERSDTIRTDETWATNNTDGGMGDLLTKLNSLDDFFDDTTDGENDDPNRYSTLTIAPYTQDLDSDTELYDQETAPILQRTLARTASISSLHTAAIDQRTYPSVMSPTAFTSPTATTVPPQRPALHSQSITSPANSLPKSSNNFGELLSDEEAEESFSEDERAPGHSALSASKLKGSATLRNAKVSLRKMVPGSEGKEYRQRGLFRSQSRGHGQPPGSPKVPKVPEAYLRDPRIDADPLANPHS